jgi:hypothetical protein
MVKMSFDERSREGWPPLLLGIAVAWLSACTDSDERPSEGQVEIVQEMVGKLVSEGKVRAGFYRSEQIPDCGPTSADQGCSLFPCPPPAPAEDEPSLPAGNVSIATKRGFVQLTQGPNGCYADVRFEGVVPLWGSENETEGLSKITVDITGKYRSAPPLVHVFEGPGPILLTDPPMPETTENEANQLPVIPISLVRSEGLALTWEGGTTGFVEVVSTIDAQQPNRIVCRWPVEELSHRVPPNMLAGLSAGQADLMVSVRTATAEHNEGVWRLQIYARRQVVRLSATVE